MKVYYYLNRSGFSNCYIIANEKNKEAILIDPGQVTEGLINRLEENNLSLTSVLITHNHKNHVQGLKTLLKIYSPRIYGADLEIEGVTTTVISGDGKIKLAGLLVHHMSLPGHTADSMIYKIENAIFSGDSISAGTIGSTNSSYSRHILKRNIEEKIFSLQDNTVIFPGHGPLTTVGTEKSFNIGFREQKYTD